ncbi:MAG: M56 family metallopeptidase, partial [Candidatus Krumholzibacteriia bacterium]
MSPVSLLLRTPEVQALGWALVHFLWQGTAVFVLLEGSLLLLRRRSSQTRYLMSCAALLLMLALPVTTMKLELGPLRARSSAIAFEQGQVRRAGGISSAPDAGVVATVPPAPLAPPTPTSVAPANGTNVRLGARVVRPLVALHALFPRLERGLAWFVGIWLAGVLALSLRLMAGWRQAQQLRFRSTRPAAARWQRVVSRLGRQLRVSRAVLVLESSLAEVPAAIGWLRPVILVPTSALTGLTPQQLEGLLAHELAHIRRHDYLVNMLQTVVETLLFYHPAVWWVSSRIRQERENCCDDAAVTVCGDTLEYARALTAMEELRGAPSRVRLAMAADGGPLLQRVQRLVGRGTAHAALPTRWLAGTIVATITLLLVAAAQRAGVARAADPMAFVPSPQPIATTEAAAGATADVSPASRPRRVSIAAVSPPSRASACVREPDRPAREYDDVLGRKSARKEEAQPAPQLPRPAPPRTSLQEGASSRRRGDRGTNAQRRESRASSRRRARKESPRLSVEELVRMRIHDVDPEFIQEMEELGFEDVSIDDLVELRIHGVDAEFMREMESLGFEGLSADELSQLRIHGVDAGFAHEMQPLDLGVLAPERLLQLRIHGVDADFVGEMEELGFGDLQLDELLQLRMRGFDAEYVREMERLDIGDLSAADLLEMRLHGIDADFVRDMQEAGLDDPFPEVLIQMRIHGVGPELIRAIRDGDLSHISVEELIRLKNLGIDAAILES